MRSLRWLLFCLSVTLFCGVVQSRPVLSKPRVFEPSRTLYVSPSGADEADGLTRATALRTISAAARLVRPGDLVLVGGGEYREHVYLQTAGTAENPIVFRAMPGETPVIDGSVKPAGWERVPGTRFAYRAHHAQVPNYLMDERYLARYLEAPDIGTLDDSPGSYIYDAREQLLTVHCLRGLSPEDAPIVVVGFTVSDGVGAPPGKRGYKYAKGFWLQAAHNRVEGFTVVFQPIGIQLRDDYTEAWGNTVYGCVDGLNAYKGEHNLFANNTVFLNDGSGLDVGKFTRFARLEGNLAWGNTPRGPFLHPGGGVEHQLAIYGRVHDPIVIGNLVIGGRNPMERGGRILRYKSAHSTVTTHRNTIVGGNSSVSWGKRAEYINNTLLGGRLSIYAQGSPLVNEENALKANAVVENNLFLEKYDESGYADPVRFDYRLNSSSPHHGVGAWPEAARILYVSADGDDDSDGGSPASAWRTLGKALAAAGAGATIYVMPGEYRESIETSVKAEADNPLELLTYGRGHVVLSGGGEADSGIVLRGAEHVRVDGFIFRGFKRSGIEVIGGGSVFIGNNVFDGLQAGVAVEGGSLVTVENCSFVDGVVGVRGRALGDRLVLRNNLQARAGGVLANLDAPSRVFLISERNAFAGPEAAGQLAIWRTLVDEAHASLVADADVRAPAYELPAMSRWSFSGLGHSPLGARGEPADASEIALEEFSVPYRAPDRVEIEWYTPYDYANARLRVYKGDKFISGESFNQHHGGSGGSALRLARVSLSPGGLEPATEYRAELELWTNDGRRRAERLEFATPAEYRAPATLYVSPDGDDGNSGRGRDDAFSTLKAATYNSSEGDTILVAPGVYRETLRLLCGGLDPERRLTVRSEVPGEAIIDQAGFYPSAIVAGGMRHITIDGFRIRGMVYSSGRRSISLSDVEDVELVNCVFEAKHGGGTSCTLLGGPRVRDARIRDNFFRDGFYSISFWHSENIEIARNTFYDGGVTAVQLHGELDANYRITDNIFYDVVAPFKANAAVRLAWPSVNLVVRNNLFCRDKAVDMGLVGVMRMRDGETVAKHVGAMEVGEIAEMFGTGEGCVVADPLFENPGEGDFRLRAGSPAIGAGTGGGNMGMANPPVK